MADSLPNFVVWSRGGERSARLLIRYDAVQREAHAGDLVAVILAMPPATRATLIDRVNKETAMQREQGRGAEGKP